MKKIRLKEILFSFGDLKMKSLKLFDYWVGGLIAFCLPALKKQDPVWNGKGRILVIRPGGLGDAIFLLPILKALKDHEASIDILCEPRNAEAFISQGYPVFFYNQLRQVSQVLKGTYDIVIDTEQWHFLSGILGYFVKSDYKIGFATRKLRAKLFNKQISFGDDDYELDNFIRLFDGVLPAQSKINDINNCFDIPDSTKEWARGAIETTSVTIFLGASIQLRRFSKSQLIEIIKNVLSNNQYPVLLGGRDVLEISDDIIKEINDSRVLSFVGKTTLMQSAALIQRSHKFIGPDSGLMHLACAVGTPVVAVFGPGNLKKWHPKGSQHSVITENASCSPCTRFGYTVPTCHGTYHCVKNIKLIK